MSEYTPVQTVTRCKRELWWLIRLVETAQVQLDEQSKARVDLGEVEKVLRSVVAEVGRILRLLHAQNANQRNRRPGADLALKAQLAKARQAVASVLEEGQDGPSHK